MKLYVMNVTPLLEDNIFRKALSFVDSQRAEKVKQLKVREEQARSLGAGLLLQYGLLQEKDSQEVTTVSVSEILEQKSVPMELLLTYKDGGKPYLNESFRDTFFSLSHSGEYAACAVDREEIGMDIQYKREDIRSGLAGYLFTKSEQEQLKQCVDRREYMDLFYYFFSAKEAYIKLTGQGMRQEMKELTVDSADGTILRADTGEILACLSEYPVLKDYSLITAQNGSCLHTVI